MSNFSGPDEALQAATKAVREAVPNARCELQDYQFRIGCGELDERGDIQEVVIPKSNWNEEAFRHAGKVLANKLKTGGSTAG